MSSVLSRRDLHLHARIARLGVLFEDLRIEIAGIAADDLDKLDDASKNGRRLYFLRRSIGTLYEFDEALTDLNGLDGFSKIRAAFSPKQKRLWLLAVKYFLRHRKMIERVRHNVGGYFGVKAAKTAIKNLDPQARGSVEIAFYGSGGGAKLAFASEIAATALVWNLEGKDLQAKVRKLIRMAVIGFRRAIWAVDCITVAYLWDRFGK